MKWISVKDDPPAYERVFVKYMNGDTEEIAIAKRTFIFDEWQWETDCGCEVLPDYWMRLPV